MKINEFDRNALCELGASVSVMPKNLYDMLELKPLEDCVGTHFWPTARMHR